MTEEEVLAEVEAALAVYGDDCIVLDKCPPQLHVHIKPRTADDSSQQFVEAVVGIQAGPQYPDEPPHISIIDSKGLDEKRQTHLIASICDKANELSSYFMLVALCEEAVEMLTSMNHPDGDCPLCLHPLVDVNADNNVLPFMKLMSCFHCFHCECIIRWWNWLQKEKEKDPTCSSVITTCHGGDVEDQQGMQGTVEQNTGRCPVCRKIFNAKDIEHVLDLVETLSKLSSGTTKGDDDEILLQSESENIRRQKFDATLKLQQENSGLIEPKKNIVLQPGMFLQRPNASSSTVSDKETTKELHHRDPAATSVRNSSSSPNRPSSSVLKNTRTRKQHRGQNSRNQVKQWIRKDSGST